MAHKEKDNKYIGLMYVCIFALRIIHCLVSAIDLNLSSGLLAVFSYFLDCRFVFLLKMEQMQLFSALKLYYRELSDTEILIKLIAIAKRIQN